MNVKNMMSRKELMEKTGITTREGLRYRIKAMGELIPIYRIDKTIYYKKSDAEKIIAFGDRGNKLG